MYDEQELQPIAPEAVEQVEQEIEQTEQQREPVQPKEVTKPSESFSQLRAKAERIERERDAALMRLEQLDKQRESQEVTDDELNIAPDDLVDGKNLSKVDRKIKRLEGELNKYKQQSTVSVTEARLKAEYPDFDSVVSGDNIEALRLAYPEVAKTLQSSQDLYSTAVSAYTLIKKLGIVPEQNYSPDKQKAQLNAAKPRSLASVSPQQGDSPLSRANAFANGLTEELKQQLYKEMVESRRQM